MFALFAQARGGNAAAAGGGGMDFTTILVAYAVIFAIAFLIQIFFLLSVSKCLKQIRPENRKMEPGMVWLCLIPIFGFIWFIIMVLKVSESLDLEYEDRRLRPDGDFGKTLGIVMIVSAFICGPVSLICWIMYWMKIAKYTKALRETGDEDDEEDDRPRKRSRRDEDDEEEEERPRRPGRRPARAEDDDDEDDRPRRR